MDSAVALAFARRAGFACHALSVDYGQRHRSELLAAGRVARALGVVRHVTLRMDLRTIGGSALTDEIAVPKDRLKAPGARTSGRVRAAKAAGGGEIPITYVPARNTIFLSCALGLAETCGARDLFIGVNAIDYSGYPDCRPEFIEAFERLANLATRAGVERVVAKKPASARSRKAAPLIAGRGPYFRVHAPLETMSKAEIVLAGVAMGVDFGLTQSCYDPGRAGRACGRCDACILRARGFADAGIKDPGR